MPPHTHPKPAGRHRLILVAALLLGLMAAVVLVVTMDTGSHKSPRDTYAQHLSRQSGTSFETDFDLVRASDGSLRLNPVSAGKCEIRCGKFTSLPSGGYHATLPVGFTWSDNSESGPDRAKLRDIRKLTYWDGYRHRAITVEPAPSQPTVKLPANLLQRRAEAVKPGEKVWISPAFVRRSKTGLVLGPHWPVMPERLGPPSYTFTAAATRTSQGFNICLSDGTKPINDSNATGMPVQLHC